MSKAVMQGRQIGKMYRDAGEELQILDGVELVLNAGEQVAIMGSSGSGKSTLLNILSGLDKPTDGTVEVVGQDLFALSEAKRAALRNAELGFVYQFHHLLPEFSALENVAIPQLLGGRPVAEARERAAQLLGDVGLAGRLKHKPGQLSGGERQRVAIARALINQPSCVLMDEPTGNLDQHTAQEVQALMHRLNEQFGIAFLVVTHDLELARQMDRLYVLEEGCLRQG
ncbi:lipoprotein-releasing ABC transporter ATP-binding protein LolD [Marinobacterium arenosum]|uniref:lipoprotein-releasing ABC transporter ATP-binding protein LolD n=1 Tax=Marinobacterium arenosum TaxID=2862496 RepID=UPI001C978D38|nr:lipoprotein-releasing ABC transporter ATP-binding protein LolD [Marinobacterium arenosum]MBY4675270.1 lipoprotein-releasing ABC transporter ATP-binding protein LolD [Marinobacterium arenosum]